LLSEISLKVSNLWLQITDRVVIDTNSYYNFQEMGTPTLLSLDPIKPVASNSYGPPPVAGIQQQPFFLADGSVLPPPPKHAQPDRPCRRRRRPDKRCDPTEPQFQDQGPAEVKPLTEEQLILCVPWVQGFVLKEKNWYQLAVESVKDITWNDAFSNLVLPHQEKDLLLAFAESKINASMNESTVNVFDDFVDGKGRGVIILLSGSPGVGKTLTAESIAEKMQVPLYTLSAGEIGIMPSTVESEIKAALEKCAEWNAILLLDEADVFLEKRELNSLKRNELVSIFLRLLEYYEGTMFLTTNRVSTIDPAFESRIDVSINYPDLTPELRYQIWAKFLFRSEQIQAGLDLTEKELGPLAQLNLNGRQIKSAVKTAQLLATSKVEPLGIVHLNAVLRLHRGAAWGLGCLNEKQRSGTGTL
jgi:ATPase family associated with various cellular activities (AAA)